MPARNRPNDCLFLIGCFLTKWLNNNWFKEDLIKTWINYFVSVYCYRHPIKRGNQQDGYWGKIAPVLEPFQNKDSSLVLLRELKQRRFWATHVNQKWGLISLFICLDANKFVLLSFFSLIKMSLIPKQGCHFDDLRDSLSKVPFGIAASADINEF